MLLLVSVSTANEAASALAGGADVIDAKDPDTGALGQVALDEVRGICTAVGGVRPVTAALGDVSDNALIEQDARSFAAAGARLMKIGFAGISDLTRAETLTAAAVRGAREGSGGMSGIVVVAYADAMGAHDLKATESRRRRHVPRCGFPSGHRRQTRLRLAPHLDGPSPYGMGQARA